MAYQTNFMQRFFSFKKFLVLNLITIITWQSLSYASTVSFSIIYTYIALILLFHIPNVVFTYYLVNSTKHNNLTALLSSGLNNKSSLIATFCIWLSNAIWYPSVFTFILSNLGYAINYKFTNNEYFIYSVLLYLIILLINRCGFKLSFKSIFYVGGLVTIIPIIILISYFTFFLADNYDLVKTWFLTTQFPTTLSYSNLDSNFILAIVTTLIGFEQSSLYLDEIYKAKASIKKIHFVILSTLAIFITLSIILMLSYLAHSDKVDSNYLVVYSIIKFFNWLHLEFLGRALIILFIIGEFIAVFAWVTHTNKAFTFSLNKVKISWGIIQTELVIFIVYLILLKIFPALSTSIILYNLSAVLSISYYIVIYVVMLKVNILPLKYKLLLGISTVASFMVIVYTLLKAIS